MVKDLIYIICPVRNISGNASEKIFTKKDEEK